MKNCFTLFVLAFLFLRGTAQTCDTIFNLTSPLDTPTLLEAGPDGTGAGYISGNNMYGDLAKAEEFAVTPGNYLTSAKIWFGYVAINPTDTNGFGWIYAWDNSNTNGSLAGNNAPGVAFDSALITLGQIAQSISLGQPLQVFFLDTPALYTDSIFVGLVLPAVAGDSIALLTNNAPPGPDGNGWELTALGAWSSYNNDWGITSGSLGNYISIGTCPTPPTDSPATILALNRDTICAGGAIFFHDLTASSPAPNYWTWIFGDGGSSNLQSPSYTYANPGTYEVVEMASNDTGGAMQVFIPTATFVTVLPAPSIAVTIVDSSATDTTFGFAYITVSSQGESYFATWSTGAYGDTLSMATAGTYTVYVVNQDGCSSSATVTITSTTGIIQINANQEVAVFPNPASNVLNVVSSTDLTGNNVQIYDATGRLVAGKVLEGPTNTINVSSLANGAYIMKIINKANETVGQNKFTVIR
jgi:hypothetical protein